MKKGLKKGISNVGKSLAILATPLIMANCSGNSDGLKFVAGGVTGLAIHEGSHYAAGKMTGMGPEYDVREPFQTTMNNYHDKKTGEKAFVSGAGLVSQTIATEVVLNSEGISKNDPYTLGLLTFNIGNSIKNAIFPDFWGDGNGDVDNLDENGIDKKFVQAALLAHSATAIYRLWNNNEKLREKVTKPWNLLFRSKEDGLEATVKYKF